MTPRGGARGSDGDEAGDQAGWRRELEGRAKRTMTPLGLGRYEEGLKTWVADGLARLRGPDQPDTTTARNNRATTLHSHGRFDEALAEQTWVADTRARRLGPDHLDTI